MRRPCVCGATTGTIRRINGQDTVRCDGCGAHQYNAPRTEVGERPRDSSNARRPLSPSARADLISRWGGRCALCGSAGELHIGHVLSVKDGLALGLTDEQINQPCNLIPLCGDCNLGLSSRSFEPGLLAALIRARGMADAE